MRMRKLVSRAKKYAKSLRAGKPRRARTAVLAVAVAVALITVVGAAMFASPARETVMPQAQRIAENKRAQAELAAPAADYAAASSTAASAAPKAAPITLTGCLEQRDDEFRLKDASGADVPRTRSWKSGFLKKNSAAIGVVDAAHRLKLQDHVGERVAVTGELVDREMRARALKRVADGCS